MSKVKKGSINNLRYIFLFVVVAFGLITIVGTGGGGGDGGEVVQLDRPLVFHRPRLF